MNVVSRAPRPGERPKIRGNSSTQNKLVGKLNKEISRRHRDIQERLLQTIREDMEKVKIVDEYLDTKRDTFTRAARSAKRSMEDSNTLASGRMDLALSYVYADILRDLEDLENVIEKSRVENDEAVGALEVLEMEIANSLNSLLFFKKLYSSSFVPTKPKETATAMLALVAGIIGIMVLLREYIVRL